MIKLGDVEISLEQRIIRAEGKAVNVGARAFDVLEMLIRAKGALVEKEHLMDCVWPDTIVEDNNLQVHVSSLRKALGKHKDLIKTISGRGYRLSLPREAAPGTHESASHGMTGIGTRPNVHELPRFYAPLFGRAAAIAEVQAASLTVQLVTLVGPGGIGKTQLGIEVARREQARSGQAVCFVALAPDEAPQYVLRTVARALGHDALDHDVTIQTLEAVIAGRDLLLVLDNCEHVIHEAASLCERLVQVCPQLRILATSREPMQIACEQLYWVAPLDVSAVGDDTATILRSGAVQMFVSRSRALDPHFVCDDEGLAQIATICRRLDGVPLAIELAAARAATHCIQALIAELDDRFRVLTGGMQSAPPRQRTLKATLDWSYQFLSAVERIVLRRICILRGEFPLALACQIAAWEDLGEEDVVDAIAGLASKSLLMSSRQGPYKTFYLQESTRVYARQKLDEADESARVAALYERCLETHGAPQRLEHRGTCVAS